MKTQGEFVSAPRAASCIPLGRWYMHRSDRIFWVPDLCQCQLNR